MNRRNILFFSGNKHYKYNKKVQQVHCMLTWGFGTRRSGSCSRGRTFEELQNNSPLFMTTQHLENLAQEEVYRALFRDSDETILKDPYHDLLNVFENTKSFVATPDPDDGPIILGHSRPTLKPGELLGPKPFFMNSFFVRVVVETKEQFTTNWENFIQGN